MFAAKEIEVLGNHQFSEEQVLELAGLAPGVNIFAVNLGVARKRLLTDGWVAEARVGREIPDRLVVRIREHEPMLILDLGDKYIMSREATIIKAWEETDPFDLPLVTGLDYSDLPLGGSSQSAVFAALMQALGTARSEEGALSLAKLRKIDVDPLLGITLYTDGAVKSARVGFEKYDEKFRRVDRLLAAMDRGQSDPGLEITELEYDNRIVAGPF
jgi:cell division protein FtsQ